MKIVDEIQALIDKPTDPTLFPVEKNGRILVGRYSVKQSKTGYIVYNEKKQSVATLETKIAAVALAKMLNRNQTPKQEIERLDRMIAKHTQDCVFYDCVLKSTDDAERRQNLDGKLWHARSKICDAQDKLAGYIYAKRLNS
jgi:hypothetical protein